MADMGPPELRKYSLSKPLARDEGEKRRTGGRKDWSGGEALGSICKRPINCAAAAAASVSAALPERGAPGETGEIPALRGWLRAAAAAAAAANAT
ncbi:hypothetical protein cyc_04207 [Cyclospora cayetanensis]|uniref:Uncharacterized protein n=1 Tax=Cyclospora cayetanensis TaxID=88456 RepID=A0A1D3CY57_9EIME|nr:hypothetical protein cyc_04207 [Cyclospora cayetanensis]